MATYYELSKIIEEIEPLPQNSQHEFDPLQLAKRLGIFLSTYADLAKSDSIFLNSIHLSHAFLMVSDDGYTIYYDTKDPYALFYVSHEIAHYLLKHNKDEKHQETDANLLAMLMWAPPSFFEGKANEHNVSLVCHAPKTVCSLYAAWLNEEYFTLEASPSDSFAPAVTQESHPVLPRRRPKRFRLILCCVIGLLMLAGGTILYLSSPKILSGNSSAINPTKTPVAVSQTATVSLKQNHVNANATTASAASKVYVTKSGHKYHTQNCYYIKGKSDLIIYSISEAVDRGYSPCLVCHPETTKTQENQ